MSRRSKLVTSATPVAQKTAPTGEKLSLTLRAVHGQPGSYTDDFVLTQPGVYRMTAAQYHADPVAGAASVPSPASKPIDRTRSALFILSLSY